MEEDEFEDETQELTFWDYIELGYIKIENIEQDEENEEGEMED